MNFNRLENENERQYIWRTSKAVDSGEITWQDFADRVNKEWRTDESEYRNESAYRKPLQGARAYYEDVFSKMIAEDGSLVVIDDKIKELRKERMKLQTANVERNRLDRNEARQELYYEQIGSLCQTLPVPEFIPYCGDTKNDITYVVAISDQHYGATFESERNTYSPEIFKERLEYLTGRLISFITDKKVNKLVITSLGDSLQGILRMSDLAINDTAVVKAVVDYSRLIAQFLNELSRYADISYYHVPTANHTQIRPLNSKASEIAAEDLEYVIGNYIKDMLTSNPRVTVNLADNGKQYIKIEDVFGFDVYALHGHQVKNPEGAISNLSTLINSNVDAVLMGHYHGGKETTVGEGVTHDCEVLIAPSFIGSDPYSDSLFTGSKGAVKIYGFDELYGHTESYKIILN